MDWSTVIFGAGVSAIVSAVVSVVAVRSVTVRRARAERAEASRLAVKGIVEPLLNKLARYEFIDGKPNRTMDTSDLDDHATVVKIRAAAGGLPSWRRALVDRRCRRVFGRYWVDLADGFPSSDSLHSWFAAAVKDDQVKLGGLPTDGLMHRAYMEPAGGSLQRQLRRELRRLARSR